MGHALIRQALLLAQHHSSDAFHRLPGLLPLHQIATLDDLATELFAVRADQLPGAGPIGLMSWK